MRHWFTLGFVRQHRVAAGSWLVLALVVALLAAYSLNTVQFPVHKAELNDGGVWVTDQSFGISARDNKPVAQLDGVVWPGTPGEQHHDGALDIRQNGSAVFSQSGSTLTPIDVALARPLKDQAVSVGGDAVFLGGTAAGVVDSHSGKVWATAVDPTADAVALSSLDGQSKPIVQVGGDAWGTATVGGSVFAASGDTGRLTTIPAIGSGLGAPSTTALSAKPAGAIKSMTAVGESPVVLDSAGNLIVSGGKANVGDAAVQQPGPAASRVLAATPDGLVAVSLSSGSRTTLAKASGTPVAPVLMPNGCLFAAWISGSQGQLANSCGNATVTVTQFGDVQPGAIVTFRVNRTQILLNDVVNGDIWQVDGGKAVKVSNVHQEAQTQVQQQQAQQTKQVASQSQPPSIPDQTLGARPGHTTVLHVLDDAKAAPDSLLSITDVKTPANPAVTVQIAPDRQTLVVTLAPGMTGTVPIDFTVDDGLQHAEASIGHGHVNLAIKTDSGSSAPTPRTGFSDPTYSAALGSTLSMSVASDWRDKVYGDPVIVSDVQVAGLSGSTASLMPSGEIRFQAPTGDSGAGGTAVVNYTVSTGGAATTAHSVPVTIPAAGGQKLPVQPAPDVTAGEVGGTIVIHPLDNDIPGADPSQPLAKMQLLGVDNPAGLTVTHDSSANTVTVVASKAGTYFLDYRVGMGSAPPASSRIRVDVAPASQQSEAPVTLPITATVRGTAPATVDVLASAYDPRGQMLVVQSAAAVGDPSTSPVDVSIVDGRWMRISARSATMSPATQAITYTVSNGQSSATGSVTVTQLPAISGPQDAPIADPNSLTVRAGDSLASPVLDNATTPSGNPVQLVADPAAPAAGEYRVIPAVGHAYMDGRSVRYVPPATVTGPQDVQVRYVVGNAADPTAGTAIGTLSVHITPQPDASNPDQPPAPQGVEGRVMQGDTVTLRLPEAGADPDGDSVSITGVASAPTLGRVVSYSGNTLVYQAFPGQAGTDTFSYVATDPFGLSSTGTVRVGVVPPGPPQAPVAIDQSVKAAPGRTVYVDVLGTSLHTPGTDMWIEPLSGSSAKMSSDQGPIEITAPGDGQVKRVPFTITNGLTESKAQITVTGAKGFENPPVVGDLYAEPGAADTSVDVEVLGKTADLDDPSNDLKVDSVGGKGATISGSKIHVQVTDKPQAIPFRVVDKHGAAAAGTIYVPSHDKYTPYLKADGLIKMNPGQTTSVNIGDYVVSPSGANLTMTTTDKITAAPTSDLSVHATGSTTLSLTAGAQSGPGTVSFEVSDKSSLTDPNAHRAIITIPVQIGDGAPILTCPSGDNAQVLVAQGGDSKTVNLTSVCHVWTMQPGDKAKLKFSSTWSQSIQGVQLSTTDKGFKLTADPNAPVTTGSIKVGVAGGAFTSTIGVRVVKLPPPTLQPIPVIGADAGQPTTVDLGAYLNSALPAAKRNVVVTSVAQTSGGAVSNSIQGTKVTFTPAQATSGNVTFGVEVSDIGNVPPTNRERATGVVTLSVIHVPEAPTNLQVGTEETSGFISLSWTAPDPHGSAIDRYEVQFSGPNSGTQVCAGSPCDIQVGKNSRDPYTLQVHAHNGAKASVNPGGQGWSPWSATVQGKADALIGPALNPRVTREMDGSVSIAWDPPATCNCSPVQHYMVTWPGGQIDAGTATTASVTGLTNGDTVTVTVTAMNDIGWQKKQGSPVTLQVVASGKPATPAAPTLTPTNTAGNTSKAVTVSWTAPQANGKLPLTYTVNRTGGAAPKVVCQWVTATSCPDNVTNDGTVYNYTITARNAAATDPVEVAAGTTDQHVSQPSPASALEAAAQPDPVTINSLSATGADGAATMSVNIGASHGAQNAISCTVSPAGSCSLNGAQEPTAGASNVPANLSGLQNGATSTVSIHNCNGSNGGTGAGTACSGNATRTVVTYGPIGAVNLAASASGTNTNWSWNVQPNGKPVHVVLTRDGAQVGVWDTGVGYASVNGSDDVGYSHTSNYTLTVTDSSPVRQVGGSPITKTASATTPPPPPTVVGYTGNAAPTGLCQGDPNCRYIGATLSNFSGPVTCSIKSDTDPGGTAGFITWNQGNGSADSPDAQGYKGSGYQIVISCGGVDSAPFTWNP